MPEALYLRHPVNAYRASIWRTWSISPHEWFRSGSYMPFSAVYHPEVKARDIPKLNADVRQRIRRAIENRLLIAPQEYGEPLRKTLKGYWKLRVGDYRIVFKVLEDEIHILGICHRN